MTMPARRIAESTGAWAMKPLRLLFCLLLILVVVPLGAVDEVALHALAIGFFGVAGLSVLTGGPDDKVRGAYWVALAAALFIGLWIVIQARAMGGLLPANPIWADAAQTYGPMAPSISVSPGDTLEGLIAALLPFTVFLTALVLFPSDTDALGLIRMVVMSGVVICIVGLLQFLLTPDMLLLAPKRFYLESLTAVFVNRNTAATYIAMIMIFAAGLTVHSIRNAGFRDLIRFLIGAPSRTTKPDAIRTLAYGAATALALVCLMLTQSRAGIGSALAGLFLMAAILANSPGESRHPESRRGVVTRRASLWRNLTRSALALAAIVCIGLLFAGQAILRAGAQGASDLRFCFLPSLVDMTRDNGILGTGFGTFRDVFPAYRNPACGMDGVLLQAHNFYLEGWISLGLPFVAAALLVIASLLFLLTQGVRSRRRYRWVPAAGLAVLILQLMHNSVDFSIQNPGVAAVFSTLLAASVTVARGRQAKIRIKIASEAVESGAKGR